MLASKVTVHIIRYFDSSFLYNKEETLGRVIEAEVAKGKVAKIFASKSSEAVTASPFQGEMLRLLEEEGQDVSWKATIHRVPRGVMQSGLGPTPWLLQTTWRGGGGRSTQSATWMAATPPAHWVTFSVLAQSPWTGSPSDMTLSSSISSTPSSGGRRKGSRCMPTSVGGG